MNTQKVNKLSKEIFKKLDKKEFENIVYVKNILNGLLPLLQTNNEIFKLTNETDYNFWLYRQVGVNSEVDFQQLFRSLFRSYYQYRDNKEVGNIDISTPMLYCSMTILNEIILRLKQPKKSSNVIKLDLRKKKLIVS